MGEKRALYIIERRIQHQINKANLAYSKSSDQDLSLAYCAEAGELWRLLEKLKEFESKYL